MKLTSAVKAGFVFALMLFLVCCALIGWGFFTPQGSNKSLSVLQKHMSNLSYTYESGNLANGIVFKDLQWNLKNKTQISVKDIMFEWNPRCWRGKELCIKTASADEVKIVLAHSQKKSNPIVLPPLKIPFSIVADSLSIKNLIVENSARKPLKFQNIEFNGSVKNSILKANSLKLDWLWIHARLDGTMDLLNNYPVALQGTINSIDESLSLPVRSDLSISGDLLELQIDAQLSEPYPATVNGELSVLTRKFPANLDINWKESGWPRLSDVPHVYANDGEFNLSGLWPNYDLMGTTRVSGNAIPTSIATMTGTINTKRATFNPLLLKTLGGVVEADGTFKWRNGLSWQTNLQTDLINPSLYWKGFDGNLSGSTVFAGRTNNGLNQLNFTDLDIQGRLKGHLYSITGNASKSAEGAIYLSAMEASSANNTVSANGKIDASSDLSLFFSLKSPQDFISELVGDINGDLVISGDIRKPDISGKASSASLRYLDTTITNTKLEGTLRALGQDESDVKAVINGLKAKNLEFNTVVVNLNGSLTDHYVRARAKGSQLSIKELELVGSIDEYQNWSGIVKKVSGMVGTHPAWLDSKFPITWIKDSKSLALEPHCWTIEFSAACIRESALLGRTGVVDFSLDGLNLQAVDELFPPNIKPEGILRSTGILKWGAGNKRSFDLESNIKDARITLKDQKTKMDIQFNIPNANIDMSTTNSLVNTRIQIDTDKLGQINSALSIDTNIDNYPLRGTVSIADSELAWLRTYLPQLTKLTGKLQVDANLGGYLSAPEFNGLINITDATVASPQLPLALNNISLDLKLDQKSVELTGNAKSGGRDVNLKGNGTISDDTWESDLNISADRIAIEHEYLQNALISPDLNIRLNPAGITIGGEIFVPKANIRFDDFGAGGVPISKDVVIVDAATNETTQKSSIQQNISSRVKVNLGEEVKFTGYGLNADLTGNLLVKLAPQRTPEIIGEIITDAGTYRSYGQNLIIRDGRINFVGPLEQAALSVEAYREVGDLVAGLRVNGLLNNPKTALFSEPQLPDEEILSYLVLGRQFQFGPRDENSDDSRLLANAALFMGISNGRALSKGIAKNLGIDDFALSAAGTGDNTQVMLSGRVYNRLLVRYGVGVFNSINTLFLRYDLADKLYLETTQGVEKAVDLFYSFEFD